MWADVTGNHELSALCSLGLAFSALYPHCPGKIYSMSPLPAHNRRMPNLYPMGVFTFPGGGGVQIEDQGDGDWGEGSSWIGGQGCNVVTIHYGR